MELLVDSAAISLNLLMSLKGSAHVRGLSLDPNKLTLGIRRRIDGRDRLTSRWQKRRREHISLRQGLSFPFKGVSSIHLQMKRFFVGDTLEDTVTMSYHLHILVFTFHSGNIRDLRLLR